MTCRELAELLAAYLDGEASAAEREVIDGHLSECPDCVTYLANYRKLGPALRGLPGEQVEVPEALVRLILNATEA